MNSAQRQHQGGSYPLSFSKKEREREREREKEKRGKIKKKEGKNKKIKKITTNDHNTIYKWVKSDEFLRC